MIQINEHVIIDLFTYILWIIYTRLQALKWVIIVLCSQLVVKIIRLESYNGKFDNVYSLANNQCNSQLEDAEIYRNLIRKCSFI